MKPMQPIGVAALATLALLLVGCAGQPYQVFAVQVAWAPAAATAASAASASGPATPTLGGPPTPHAHSARRAAFAPQHPQWDLNHATVAELAQLPGIDPPTLLRITAARPYRAKRELVTRGVLSSLEYARWKPYLVVHRAVPAPSRAALHRP